MSGADRWYLNLNLYLQAPGYDESAWKSRPPTPPARSRQ